MPTGGSNQTQDCFAVGIAVKQPVDNGAIRLGRTRGATHGLGFDFASPSASAGFFFSTWP